MSASRVELPLAKLRFTSSSEELAEFLYTKKRSSHPGLVVVKMKGGESISTSYESVLVCGIWLASAKRYDPREYPVDQEFQL